MRNVIALALVSCAGASSPQPMTQPTSTAGVASGRAAPSATVATTTAPTALAPKGAMTRAEARRYMLKLLNRDRATQGLGPITLDEGAGQTAGQAHAEDMAHLGYLGHWGSDGSVPEDRITHAGGADVDFENAYCLTDEKTRDVDGSARFTPEDIEKAEAMFFDEKPPYDGHRKTILGVHRNRVGIGIAMPKAGPNELVVPCISQEFTDSYGTYDAIPKSIKLGAVLHVAGTLSGDVKLGAVGLGRLEDPHPIPAAELNRRRAYQLPEPYEMFWPHGFKTRIELQTHGQSFSIDVPVGNKNQRGLYEVSIWAQFPGDKSFSYVSLRTIRVD